MNFNKFKGSLKYYLKLKGFESSQNPMYCFNPSHSNKNTPACMIYNDNFKCASCGIHGDIYDACEILTGIKEKAEQYKEVEKTLKGYNIEEYKIEKKETFQPDQEALTKLIDYMRNHAGKEKGVRLFLKTRGYNPEMINKMLPCFGYWPGYEIAIQEVEREILKESGVPLIHPVKGKSSWDSSGVVLKLHKGIKLFYYHNDKCEKRDSKSAHTFPMPGPLPESGNIILVEAELSAISMRSIGYKNTYATGGTKGLSIKEIKEKLLTMKEIIFAFDGDEGGRKASGIIQLEKSDKRKCYPAILKREGCEGIIKIAHFPDDKDPDDLIRENKIDELHKIIKEAKIYKHEKTKKKKKKDKEYKTKEEIKDVPFIFLGHDDKAYYIYPHNQNIALRIGRGENYIKNWLKEIAPFEWWFKSFQKTDEDDNAFFNLAGAIAWFRKTSWSKGLYNDERIVGLGVYQDNDNIIFNTGNCIYIDGKKKGYNDFSGKYIYCRSKLKLEIKGKEWTIKDGINLIKQLKTFNFERKIDYMVIAGFIGISCFSSILNRRPSIWMTGQSGTGKSTLLTEIIQKCIGEQAIYTEGGGSEAFIRQMVARNCLIPIVDEFEAHNKKEQYELKKIMKLIRSCYGGIIIGKGTPDHKPIKFNTKIMFCLASVNIYIDNEADRNRLIICRLKLKKDDNYMKPIQNPIGLKVRIFNRIKSLNPNIEKAKTLLLDSGYDNRTSDTYAPFLAGFWMIISDSEFFQGDKKIQSYILKAIEEIKEVSYRTDEQKILDRIFQESIRLDPSKQLTIAEMLLKEKIDNMKGESELAYNDTLQRNGLKKFKYKNKEILAVDINNPALKNILKDTPFSDYKEILRRHDYVMKKSALIWLAGKNTRCIILDWEKVHDEYFKNQEEDDVPF